MTLGYTTIGQWKVTINSVCTYPPRLFAPIHPSRLVESLAKQSAHMARNDNDFQRNCVSQASDYRINLLGLQHLLEELGADKGLANYNSRDVLQVLLKDTTNLNKNALKAIADMIYCIPALGPLLGPSKLNV